METLQCEFCSVLRVLHCSELFSAVDSNMLGQQGLFANGGLTCLSYQVVLVQFTLKNSVFVGEGLYAMVSMWRMGENLRELFSYHVGLRDGIEVTKYGGKGLYPLNYKYSHNLQVFLRIASNSKRFYSLGKSTFVIISIKNNIQVDSLTVVNNSLIFFSLFLV